jgi:molybdenum cofactor guanylyltransferase
LNCALRHIGLIRRDGVGFDVIENMRILGAIIAGGQSLRMGGAEKGFIVLEGATLLERTLSRLRFQVDEVIINANGDATRFAETGVVVVPDHLVDVGSPLAGLEAVLRYGAAHQFDAVVTVPSDAPFLPLDLVQRLLEAGEITGAAIARSGAQDHYLTGIWTTAMARPLRQLIEGEGFRRVQDFVARARAETVVWSHLPHDPFFNINTPEDVVSAAQIARGV